MSVIIQGSQLREVALGRGPVPGHVAACELGERLVSVQRARRLDPVVERRVGVDAVGGRPGGHQALHLEVGEQQHELRAGQGPSGLL